MRYMSVLPAYNSRFHCRLCSKNASREAFLEHRRQWNLEL